MTRGFPCFACLAMAASAAFGQQASDPYREAIHYKFDQPRTAVVAIEAEIRAAKPDQLRAIEAKLLQILQSPEATTDAKAWVCRQLRQAGSERSVDALAPLLADKDLSFPARLALQSIPGKKVDEALRDAIGKLKGDLLAGVLQTIGVRGDRQAVALVGPLASDKDPGVAEAASFALGHIGGAEALRAVQEAKAPDRLNRARCHAILLCAERMAADGQRAEAAAAYHALYAESKDVVIQTGALRGLVLCDKAKAATALLSALKSDRHGLREAAAKFVCEACSGEALASVLGDLPILPPDRQVMILTMLSDKSALPAVRKAAHSSNPMVRTAAIGALGRLGDVSSVPWLLSLAAAEGIGYNAPAYTLEKYFGEEVVAPLIAAAQQGKPVERRIAIRILGFRGDRRAAPVLLKAAAESDPDLQIASLDALRRIADAASLPALVQLLFKSKGEPQRFAENAVIGTCRDTKEKDAAAAAVLAALPHASGSVRCALLRALAFVPNNESLEALRAAANDGDVAVRDTAIRALAEWPDPAAVADLLAIARSDNKSDPQKVLALRGAIRLAGLKGRLPAPQAIKLLAEAMGLSERVEEKKLALAALGDVNDPAALDLAARCLSDQALELEAATAVVKIAKSLRATNPDAAAAAIQKVLDVCKAPAARQLAEGAMVVLGGMVNIAPQGTATSPDGIEKDGDANGDQAAIDGDPATYWDEADGQKVYRLVVTFKQPEKVAAISILGYAHHNYAPKDFEILCDGRVVKKIENAQYDSNFLLVRLDETTCKTVELKITGYHGNSPAIRELGIYRPKTQK